jgi:hypothetical protein
MLATVFITWQHIHEWGYARRFVHFGLIVLFGAAGGQCFRLPTRQPPERTTNPWDSDSSHHD